MDGVKAKTYIEVQVEVGWSWDGDRVAIESVEIVQRNENEKSELMGSEILESLTDKQIEEVKNDCRKDWQKKLKDEE
jgi:hypothetical protein